jgi:hypothetical protein
MTKDVNLQNQGLLWLVDELRWERRLAELRGTDDAATASGPARTFAEDAPLAA